MRLTPFPNCPRAVHDARALIADPERAATVPASVRTLAWRILTNARGRKVAPKALRQTHMPEGA